MTQRVLSSPNLPSLMVRFGRALLRTDGADCIADLSYRDLAIVRGEVERVARQIAREAARPKPPAEKKPRRKYPTGIDAPRERREEGA